MIKGLKVDSDKHVVATERMYLNAAKDQVLPEGHPDAAYLFATPGKRVEPKEARRLGLLKDESEAKAQAEPAEVKVRRIAPEDKGRR